MNYIVVKYSAEQVRMHIMDDSYITHTKNHYIKTSNFYRCTVHFEIYVVHSPTNALFINLVKSFKFTLKYTIISPLHVSVFSGHHQGALPVPN